MKTLTKTEMAMQIKWLSDYIAYFTGSCPLDSFGWEHAETCEVHCNKPGDQDQKRAACWAEYALEMQIENWKQTWKSRH